MGLEHSQPRPPRTRPSTNTNTSSDDTMVILREEIPDAYLHVSVSDNVLKRIEARNKMLSQSQQPLMGGGDEKMKSELAREKEENQKLRTQLRELSVLQWDGEAATSTEATEQKSHFNSAEQVKDLKNKLDKKALEVRNKFFNPSFERACVDDEEKILSCLKENKGKPLNCRHLKSPYEKCTEGFGNAVLHKRKPSTGQHDQQPIAA